jgi:membrane protease YdiL (CAAX protease family)
MKSWLDVLKGPPVYRANTPWSPVAAIGAVALILSVQFGLPVALNWLSPALYQAISGETAQAKVWPQSDSPTLLLFQQIIAGLLIWLAAGLRNGKRRAVLSLPPLKGGGYTYVALALLVFSVMVPVKFLSQSFVFFLHGWMNPLLSVTGQSSTWLSAPALVIAAPLTEEFTYRGFLVSALAKSKLGFWGAAIFTDAIWTAMHAPYQSWDALPPIFVFGLLVSFLLSRTGSLWSCIFAHITINAETVLIQFVLGLVPR